MKNRKWLLNKSWIDILMTISKVCCPLWAIEGRPPKEWEDGSCKHTGNNWSEYDEKVCYQCVQTWLNKERNE